MDKLISKKDLENIITKMIQNINVFAPVNQDGVKVYKKIDNHDQIIWDSANCHCPPKELFFPVTEPIFFYKKINKGIKIEKIRNHNKKRVIIGIRPCDAYALHIMDNVFTWDYKDELYLTLRQNTVIIGLSCLKPDPFCFCTATHLSPFEEKGSDILLTDLDSGIYHARIITEKGKDLVERFKDNFKDITPELELKRDTLAAELISKMPAPLPVSDIKSWLDKNFDNPIWEKLAPSCLGCGTCAYLCPTCHCFDLVDESRGYSGERRRNWDSCAFDHFTKMAAHQPRSLQWQRFRQRIMHKFKYFMDKFSYHACVGCGRCRTLCPAGMDILQIIRSIQNQTELSKSEPKISKKGQ
ncbi:MAG: 4Fe-4S dicluster domain-containing protein [bacterium]